ncbi:uncharacterized protein PHACADRAFT_203703 [Phanerochaete carnosa HHB-10118-sp]|uniref:Uncharacterized protein n=1 Tax=Phanerochaete carnosa (strain HHB-10118-sp) TaxID=650164 RepID=K5WM52_PHACS|nr:uncharacterized protein PHACADRAFT_203703 [Phanerochaete carnosa HHB-10118-sp]EKM60515.1 hypothetical protein PHACADRAFT_203703 [Phanerochaete carnosa HHB-10118-sp]
MAPPRQWYRIKFIDHPRLCRRAPEAYAGRKPKVWCRKCLEKALCEFKLSTDFALELWDNAEICSKLREENRGWIVCSTWKCLTHLRYCEYEQPDETRQQAAQELNKINAARRQRNKLARHLEPRLAPLSTSRFTRPPNPRIWSPLPLPLHPTSFAESASELAVTIAGAMPGQARRDELWQEAVTLQSSSSITPLVPDDFAAPPFAPLASQFPVPFIATSTAFFGPHVADPGSDICGAMPLIDNISAGTHRNGMQQAALQPSLVPYMPPELVYPILTAQHDMSWMSGRYVAPDSEAAYAGAALRHITHLSGEYSIPPQPPPACSQQPVGGDTSSFCGTRIPTEERLQYYVPVVTHRMPLSAQCSVGQDGSTKGDVYCPSRLQYYDESGTVSQRCPLAPEPLRPPVWPPW